MGEERFTFGLIVDWPDPNSMYQGTLLKGIRSFAAEHDVNIVTLVVGRLSASENNENGRELLYDFMENDRLFSGFILFSSPLSTLCGTDRLYEKVKASTTLPMVSMAIELPGMPAVLIDNRAGFSDLIEHMVVHHGYTDIAYISGPEKNDEAAERLNTVRTTLSRHNLRLPDSHLFFGDFTVTAGFEAIRCFLDERNIQPEAVICANDYMGMGAWEELGNRGIIIPDDIAVTGFDDLKISDAFDLPLTTVRQPLFTQGYCAAEKLYRMVLGQSHERITMLPSEPVFRYSCGCDNEAVRTFSNVESNNQKMDGKIAGEYREMIGTAVRASITSGDDGPLMRCWHKITRSALRNRMKQSVLINFLHSVRQEYEHNGDQSGAKTLFSTHTDRMQLITTEAYIQSDALGRMRNTIFSEITISRIENLGSDLDNSLDMEQRLNSINWFFQDTEIHNCYLSLFTNLSYEKEGTSKLVFCRKDGQEIRVMEQEAYYPSQQMIDSRFLPKNRFELLVELLYDPKSAYGMIILDMKDVRFSFYEMLRTRFSAVIHDSLNRQLLKDAIQKLEDLSLTDELTGLYNRRGFFTMSEQQLRYCRREEEPYAVYYIDMDGLKTVNDRLGHDEGDSLIRMTADILRESFRTTDIIARMGGDEFAVFAPKAGKKNARVIADRIAANTGDMNRKAGLPYPVSMSIGVCFSTKHQSADISTALDQMLKSADSSMYTSKNQKKRLATGSVI